MFIIILLSLLQCMKNCVSHDVFKNLDFNNKVKQNIMQFDSKYRV